MKFRYLDQEIVIKSDLNRDDENGVSNAGFFELEFLEYVQSLRLKGSYIDIGARDGGRSIYFSRFCPSECVYSFEENEKYHGLAKQNIDINVPNGQCHFDDKRLWKDNTETNSDIGSGYEKGVAQPLDDILPSVTNISVLSIYSENSELVVLKGARKLLRNCTPLLFLKVKGGLADNSASFLSGLGYSPTGKVFEGGLIHEFMHASKGHKRYFDVSGYWEDRYSDGKTSGSGSYNRLAVFKARFLNRFVRLHGITSVTELGCGDGAQQTLADYPSYTGLDISPTVIEKCRGLFAEDDTKKFVTYDPTNFSSKEWVAELSISLDVIYHLSNDVVYEAYLRDLFALGTKYVILYTNSTEFYHQGVNERSEYVRFRDVLSDIWERHSEWKLVQADSNRYPFNLSMPDLTSFADFYVFKKHPNDIEVIDNMDSFVLHKTLNQLATNAEQVDLLYKQGKKHQKSLELIQVGVNAKTKANRNREEIFEVNSGQMLELKASVDKLNEIQSKRLEIEDCVHNDLRHKLFASEEMCSALKEDLALVKVENTDLNERCDSLEHDLSLVNIENTDLQHDIRISQRKRAGHYQALEGERKKVKSLEKQIDHLRGGLELERQLSVKLKRSVTYQAGLHLRNAGTLKGLLRLPLALYRVVRIQTIRQKRSRQLNSRPLERIASIEFKGSVSKPETETEIELKERAGLVGWPECANDLPVVMGIMDEFTTGCFNKDVNLIQPRPDNWEALAKKEDPSLIFIESAWKGNFGSWQYRVANYSNKPGNEVEQLADFGRENNIPVIFWNKEDPVHHDKFMCSAKEADVIFTTDSNMIGSYQSKTDNKKVYPLPFAAQPRLHHPKPLKGRINKACFAGTWYGDRHAERGVAMQWLLPPAKRQGLTIYDRNHGTGAFPFPDEYHENIKGSLPYEKLCNEYGNYKVFLNVNSVTNSPTMFARRVFELLACGTPVVSTYAKGIEELFGNDTVWMVANEAEAENAIRVLLTDENEWRKRSLAGIRKVFSSHTYLHRLQFIYEKVGVEFPVTLTPKVLLLAQVENEFQLKKLLDFVAGQTWSEFTLIVECPADIVSEIALPLNVEVVASEYTLSEEFNDRMAVSAQVYIGRIDPLASYGIHYMQDLVNATRYAPDAKMWGKSLSETEFSLLDGVVNPYGSIWLFSAFDKKIVNSPLETIFCGDRVYCLDCEEFQPSSDLSSSFREI